MAAAFPPITPVRVSCNSAAASSRIRVQSHIYPKGNKNLTFLGDGYLDSQLHGLDYLPAPWKQYMHPSDGRPYFFHTNYQLVTYENMRNPAIREDLETIHYSLSLSSSRLSNGHTIYLGLQPPGYYYVNYDCEEIYWAHDTSLDSLVPNDTKEITRVCFEALMVQNYYRHVELFPHLSPPHIGHMAIQRLQTALLRSCAPNPQGPVPWRLSDAKAYLDIFGGVNLPELNTSVTPTLRWFSARLIQEEYGTRIINQYMVPEERRARHLLGWCFEKIKFPTYTILAKSQVYYITDNAYVNGVTKLPAALAFVANTCKTCSKAILTEWMEEVPATIYLPFMMMFLSFYNLQPYDAASVTIVVGLSLSILCAAIHHMLQRPIKKPSQLQPAAANILNATNRSTISHLLLLVLNLPAIFFRWQLLMLASSLAIFTFSYSFQCTICHVLAPTTFFVLTGCSATGFLLFGGALSSPIPRAAAN